MAYEIWEQQTRNLVDDFPTEDAALEAVREALETFGPQYVATWVLAHENEAGDTQQIAAGPDLATLARSAPA
jgi:hypothetical protein